jgi:hypothetical protein
VQQGDNNCAVQNGNAASTVLTGSALHQVLAMYFLPNAGVSSGPRYGLQNLSIRDGYGDSATFQRGGGLQMASYTDVQVEFWLDNVIVANSSGYFGGGADFYARRGLVRIVNSQFSNNVAPTTAFAHFSAVVLAGDGPNGVLVANSTFANGQCPGQGVRGCGIAAMLGEGMRLDIINSLLFNNAISDVNIEGAAAGGFGNGAAFANLQPDRRAFRQPALERKQRAGWRPAFRRCPQPGFSACVTTRPSSTRGSAQCQSMATSAMT